MGTGVRSLASLLIILLIDPLDHVLDELRFILLELVQGLDFFRLIFLEGYFVHWSVERLD